MDTYQPQAVEAKWQERWDATGIYRTPDGHGRQTFYCLDFFPYPSGDGLSVGHGRNYVPSDVISRFRRMQGDAVLHPMGWDAFGLPAENEAAKKGIHPRKTTTKYAANYRRQMTRIGCSYDWEREISSSHPGFYHWTQWFFLMLYRRGLAYRSAGRQWWCPGCRTVLANEQVNADRVCWRGHGGVHKREMEQWYLRITAYAPELLADLDTLEWPTHILTMQRNWIGRSQGVEFEMAVADHDASLTVYTTRPDTIYGMTFAVLAPENPLVEQITHPSRRPAVRAYCLEAGNRSEVDRVSGGRDGVLTGAYAINPANGERVPIYVAEYVLMDYGGGAIMAVPAHDQRDYDFAQRHRIPAPVVIAPPGWGGDPLESAYTDPGVMVNSGRWNRLSSEEAGEAIADWLEAEGIGRRVVKYRLRDWLISRQRYWGAPIPIIHCDTCGIQTVPEEELPVLLPHIRAWKPGAEGRSPLANVPEFLNTSCPSCGKQARRETDTMDGFACSSWYHLRFISPDYRSGPVDPVALADWGPPDLYVGGAEHAVMHLLYARFWTKVMADVGLIPFREPYPVLRSQGIMHARDSESGEVRRMSKSAGNVVTPDGVADEHGADALRIYLLFMAPFENNTIWDSGGISGAKRFLARAWRLTEAIIGAVEPKDGPPTQLSRILHRTVKQVTEQVNAFEFNTAVAALMILLNQMIEHQNQEGVTAELVQAGRTFVLMLAPFAPYLAEELWERMGGNYSVHQQGWPGWDDVVAADKTVTLVVQVNGRVRDRFVAPAGESRSAVQAQALGSERVQRHLAGRSVRQVIVVPDRVVNIVTD